MAGYWDVPPIGQFDEGSCWAACLAWWLAAVGGGRPSWTQRQAQEEYSLPPGPDGAFDPATVVAALRGDPRLGARVSLHRASLYSYHRLPIGDLAAMIVYRHPVIGAHMNVIFGQVGRTLWAMEPYPYPGESGARSGALLVRSDLRLGRDHAHPTRSDAAEWAIGARA